MLCRSCNLLFVFFTSCVAVNLENLSLNRSLYKDNELWDGLMQNCGQRSAFSCVQSNIYGFLEKSLASDFYVTDSFYFKKNQNKYSEYMNTIDSNGFGFRESRSRWNKVTESFVPNLRNGERKLDASEERFGDVEENKVSSDASSENSKAAEEIEKKEKQEAESFSEFIQAVENAEKSYSAEQKPQSTLFSSTTESPSTTETQTETTTQTQPLETNTEIPSSSPQMTPAKSISDVTDMLYSRGVGYLMTHDIEMHLPQFIFGGAKVIISPRTIESDGGALFKLNIEPQAIAEDRTIHFSE